MGSVEQILKRDPVICWIARESRIKYNLYCKKSGVDTKFGSKNILYIIEIYHRIFCEIYDLKAK